MDLASVPLFGALRNKLGWLSERQTVLAENVANADTPGYAARDLKAPSFRDLLEGSGQAMPAARTNMAHIPFRGTGTAGLYRPEDIEDAPMSLNGNSVSLEEQMMEVTQTTMDYQMTVGLYKKGLGLIRTALGRS